MKFVIFLFLLINNHLYSQWVRIDSSANYKILGFPSGGMMVGESIGVDAREYCDLPLNEGEFIYYYYIRNDRSDLVYFQLVNESKKEIVSTGFFRLTYMNKNYSKDLLKAKGNLLGCWEKDLVWTYYKDGKIVAEFYDAGNKVELNGIDAYPYPRKKN
jgi:hypothetical protein